MTAEYFLILGFGVPAVLLAVEMILLWRGARAMPRAPGTKARDHDGARP